MRGSLSRLMMLVVLSVGCGESLRTTFDGGPGSDASQSMDGGAASDGGPGPGDGGGPSQDAGPSEDAGPPETCDTPGAIETVSCGSCGSRERFCTADREWAYGPCAEEGMCVPGTTDTIPCGRCGTRTARCTASCTWETTGSCTGEGECTPGERTRSGAGCTPPQTREVSCNDACTYEPAGACMSDACSTPGAVEYVSCGMCGTRERFCTASGVWDYGACSGEGVCAPGTTGTVPCGMCGTSAARCTAACGWEATGSCTGEGECAPGTRMRTSVGCPAGETRGVLCNSACTFLTEEPCTPRRPVDVMLLFDVTGSHASFVNGARSQILAELIRPLLGITDVAVGISWYADFPVSPYGGTGDHPFEGGIEPSLSEGPIWTSLSGTPSWTGGDGPESGVEALSILSGGPLPTSARGLACSSGRASGGCWRSGATRVIVMFTDAANHNGPGSPGTLYSPYTGISPAPATWPEVLTRMTADGTILLALLRSTDSITTTQYDRMLADLGQPPGDRMSSEPLGTAFATVVSRVFALAMP